MQDIRDLIFRDICGKRFRAVLLAERDGILSGAEDAAEIARELGVNWQCDCPEGGKLSAGQVFARVTAGPKEMAMAEERLIGALAKTSGIATAARRAVTLAAGKIRIVSGSWKKMPPGMKTAVRRAIVTGGAVFRLCEPPMLYMDKNFVTMFGSVKATLDAVAELKDTTKVIQIRGQKDSVREETLEALLGGGNIFMVDTGRLRDVDVCLEVLKREHARERVQVAYAGNVKLADIPQLAGRGIDLLCIGKEIVDAPLLDMKLNVLEEV